MMNDVIIRGVVSGQNFRALRARRESCGAEGPAAWPDQSKHACYAPAYIIHTGIYIHTYRENCNAHH